MQGPGVHACVMTLCVHAWESSVPACVVRPGACVHAGIWCVRTHMGVWHGHGDPACTGRGSVLCMHVHGDPVRVRMGILRACVGTWCVHAWGSCVRAFVRGDPVRARMVILHVCVCACVGTRCVYAWGSCVCAWGPGVCTHGNPVCVRSCVGTRCVHAWSSCVRACVWGPSACTHGDRACVDLVHACAGSSMHSGDSMRACVRAGIRYGCDDPAGTGRRPIPHIKAWEPACNVFAMKKGHQ